MAAHSGSASSVPSLPPPRPKSPPEYPDLYGKRREMAKVQVLEREIGFLEEELKSVESLHPASRCCKEVAEFVVANSDPLISLNRKNQTSCRFWKWLCGMPCFNFSWISWICCTCYSGCSIHLELPRCCDCNLYDCCPCACCSLPKCSCCAWLRSHCCKKISCGRDCCVRRFPSGPDCSCSPDCCCWPDCSCCPDWSCRPDCPCCPACSCCPDCSGCPDCSCCLDLDCSCCQWKCSCPKCPKVRLCCNCTKTCCACNPCCLFF